MVLVLADVFLSVLCVRAGTGIISDLFLSSMLVSLLADAEPAVEELSWRADPEPSLIGSTKQILSTGAKDGKTFFR